MLPLRELAPLVSQDELHVTHGLIDDLPVWGTDTKRTEDEQKGYQEILSRKRTFGKHLTILRLLAGGDLRGKRLLDVGCGPGHLHCQAGRLGMDAMGMDTYLWSTGSAPIEAAQRCFKAYGFPESDFDTRFRTGDVVESLPEDMVGAFDFVTSVGMLEHVASPAKRQRVIENSMAALAPGGVFFLLCGPNVRFPFDFNHYGPKFLFYHWLPRPLKIQYLRALPFLAKQGRNLRRDPDFLSGMSVTEITGQIRSASPSADVLQAFPVLMKMFNAREHTLGPVQKRLIQAASHVLTRAKAEPAVLILAQRPG